MNFPGLFPFTNTLQKVSTHKTLLRPYKPLHFAGNDSVVLTPVQDVSSVEENEQKCIRSQNLIRAIWEGKFDTAKEILLSEVPLDIDFQDPARQTVALRSAIAWEQAELVKLILDKEANVNVKNFYNESPLELAIKKRNLKIVDLLLNTKRVHSDLPDDEGITPLMRSVVSPEILTRLLQEKPHVNAQDKNGMTPLMYAAKNDQLGKVTHQAVVELLITAGADLTQRDNTGLSVVDYARLSGDIDLMKWMSQKTGTPLSGKISLPKSHCPKIQSDKDILSFLNAIKVFQAPSSLRSKASKLFPERVIEIYQKKQGVLIPESLKVFKAVAEMFQKDDLKEMNWYWPVKAPNHNHPHSHVISFSMPQAGFLKIEFEDNETAIMAPKDKNDLKDPATQAEHLETVFNARDVHFIIDLYLENGAYMVEGYSRDEGEEEFHEKGLIGDIFFNLRACMERPDFNKVASGREADGKTKRYGAFIKTINQNDTVAVQKLRDGLTPDQFALWEMLMRDISEEWVSQSTENWIKEVKAFQTEYYKPD